jgi:membrane protein YfhO
MIDRGSGVSLETSLVNSLAPACLISFVAPWATLKGAMFAETDPLLRNCYIGIIPFIFFLVYALKRNKKTLPERFCIFLFIIFLVFSLGKLGGLRIVTYYIFPLLNTFKHPAKAKLFFLFAAQLVSAFAIHQYLQNRSFYKPALKKLTWILLITALFLFFFSILNSSIWLSITKTNIAAPLTGSTIKRIRDNFSFYDTLFLNCCTLILLLCTILFLLKKDLLKKYLVPIIIVDVFIILQGMLPSTYVRNGSPKEVQKLLAMQPTGFPLPDLSKSLSGYSEKGMKYFNIIGCLNPYNKLPGRSDYVITPSNLSSQDFFWNYKLFRQKIMEYPLAYLADTVYAAKDTAAFIADKSLRKGAVFNSPVKPLNSYTTTSQPGKIIIKDFSPNQFEFHVKNNDTVLFILQQNFYYNWSVYVNDKKEEIRPANLTFMGVKLPPGNNTVVFKYSSTYFLLAAVLSGLFILSAFIWLFVKEKKIEKRDYQYNTQNN